MDTYKPTTILGLLHVLYNLNFKIIQLVATFIITVLQVR